MTEKYNYWFTIVPKDSKDFLLDKFRVCDFCVSRTKLTKVINFYSKQYYILTMIVEISHSTFTNIQNPPSETKKEK